MKKILFIGLLFVLTVYSFFFPEITVSAAHNGIIIWFEQILPTLLPFSIASAIFIKSGILNTLKKHVNIMAIILTMFCGFVFGFPIGAKLSADFYKEKLISERQANMLSVFTNNFSPIYVCGFVLPFLFPDSDLYKATYFLLYFIPLALLSVYFILNKSKIFRNILAEKKTSSFRLTMQTIDASILSGFETLIKICGYIVLFSIITQIIGFFCFHFINQNNSFLTILLGNLEITNGINLLSQMDMNVNVTYIISIQMLSFGGFSGIAQTASILSDAGLSIYKYIIGKALLSLLLTLLTVIYVLFV